MIFRKGSPLEWKGPFVADRLTGPYNIRKAGHDGPLKFTKETEDQATIARLLSEIKLVRSSVFFRMEMKLRKIFLVDKSRH